MPEPKLNPQIRSLEIGVREVREIKIYPLSMADQTEMTDLIVEIVSEFVSNEELIQASNEKFIMLAVKLIKENLEKFLALVLDPAEKVTLADMTNMQFTQLVTDIYEVNYEGMIKNFQDLAGKVKKVIQPTRSLQPSVSDTPSTDWRTSTDDPSLMEG